MMEIAEQNKLPFWRRLIIYQNERFPLLGHGVLVACFSFSAISYSRISRGAEGFIDWQTFIAGIVTTVSLFFLVRVFDEFKDAEEDRLHRSHLPVPRGLISFRELAILGAIAFAIQLVVNAVFIPSMLIIYAIVIMYLLLMGKEFFVPEWLKKHHFWYVVSHMMIIPLIDVYASGLDWFLDGVEAPFGLVFFFCVSFMNGVVLEIGRKIRIPEEEEINTYSTKLGGRPATMLWLVVLLATLFLSVLAAWYAHFDYTGYIILSCLFVICSLPGFLFLANATSKRSKFIEHASALWTVGMYLTLGGGPMIHQFITA